MSNITNGVENWVDLSHTSPHDPVCPSPAGKTTIWCPFGWSLDDVTALRASDGVSASSSETETETETETDRDRDLIIRDRDLIFFLSNIFPRRGG